MRQFLMIQNPGIAPTEGFTVLGATSKRDCDIPGIIGTFGSGGKLSISTCMRNNVTPIIFCGNLKLDFSLINDTLKSDVTDTEYNRVQVSYSGKDEEGKTRKYTEKLWAIGYGMLDWNCVAMSLREFVSNAIDHTIMYNHYNGNKCIHLWEGVKVELVDENQVRAKSGTTRVFIPATVPEIRAFFCDLGKWFMHFSEPENIGEKILPKANRNMKDKRGPVFYRRGVRVGELEYCNHPSLFDYNYDIKVDESRNLNEYNAKSESAKILASAEPNKIASLLRSFEGDTEYWEHHFDKYYMKPDYTINKEEKDKRTNNWGTALKLIGDKVISGKTESDTVQRKGHKTLVVPENFLETAQEYGVTTSAKILSQDERLGREIYSATTEVENIVKKIWGKIEEVGMSNGKIIPPVYRFSSIMSADSTCLGFYRDGNIYLNVTLGDNDSPMLRAVIIEECAHYISGAVDGARELQDWAFNFAAKLLL